MWTAYDYFDLNEVEYTHERWFVHSNILYFGCFGNVIYKIEKLTLYIGPKWISPSKASTLLPLIASIVKFSIVHDWFSALLFVTSSVRDHVGVQLRVLSNLFFVIWYLCDSYVNYGEGGGRGEWKDFPWCSAFNYIITIRSSRDLSFRHGRCQGFPRNNCFTFSNLSKLSAEVPKITNWTYCRTLQGVHDYSVIVLIISNWPHAWCDFSLNCTPLGSIIITNLIVHISLYQVQSVYFKEFVNKLN